MSETIKYQFSLFAYTGQPVAWCISDQESTEVVEAFLKSIQQRSSDVLVSVVMTDDGTYTITLSILHTCNSIHNYYN